MCVNIKVAEKRKSLLKFLLSNSLLWPGHATAQFDQCDAVVEDHNSALPDAIQEKKTHTWVRV